MRNRDDIFGGKTSVLISFSAHGVSYSVALPWDADMNEILTAFVKTLWTGGFSAKSMPDVLRDLAEEIENEINETE